jgi:hypothetical protein
MRRCRERAEPLDQPVGFVRAEYTLQGGVQNRVDRTPVRFGDLCDRRDARTLVKTCHGTTPWSADI